MDTSFTSKWIVVLVAGLYSSASITSAFAIYDLPDPCKFTASDGYFYGLNYLDVVILYSASAGIMPYPPKVDCRLHLIVSGYYSQIQLRWLMMDLEPRDGSGQCRDWVQILAKNKATGTFEPLTKILCGNEDFNKTFYTTAEEILVHTKTSDIQSTKKGYELEYQKIFDASATNPTPVSNDLNQGQLAAIIIGVVLGILLLLLLSMCIVCCLRHKDDLLSWRRYEDNNSDTTIQNAYPVHNQQMYKRDNGIYSAPPGQQNRFFHGHMYRPRMQAL